MTIGIFDSGIGGLSVLKELNRLMPDHSYIYLGDTAHFPYGKKSPEAIIGHSLQNISFLIDQKIDLLVIACHTVSTVASEAIRAHVSVPVVTITDCLIESSYLYRRVAILGTQATVDSKVIQYRLQNYNVEFFSFVSSELVSIIEEGNWHEANTILERYCECFYENGVEAALLACTHYPLLISSMRRIWGNEVQIIDPALCCAKDVADKVGNSRQGQMQFFVTGDKYAFSERAREILEIERVECLSQQFLLNHSR